LATPGSSSNRIDPKKDISYLPIYATTGDKFFEYLGGKDEGGVSNFILENQMLLIVD